MPMEYRASYVRWWCNILNMMYVVSMVSIFIVNLGHVCWEALKWVLRYLNEIISSRLKYKGLLIRCS